MKINEFVDAFKNVPSTNKDEYLDNRVIVKYISIADKLNMVGKIIKSTHYKDNKYTNKEEIYVDSASMYILYTMSIIDAYTDLDVNFSDIVNEYDLLKKNEYIDLLISAIPKEELEETKGLLNMKKNDLIQNEYYIGSYITNRITDISTSLGLTLTPVIEQLIEAINNLDDEQINKITTAISSKENGILSKIKTLMK